jgi:hypothetical protein
MRGAQWASRLGRGKNGGQIAFDIKTVRGGQGCDVNPKDAYSADVGQ